MEDAWATQSETDAVTQSQTETPSAPSIKPSKIGHPLELLTESRLKTFRRCPREHRFRYEMGIVSIQTSDAMRFGSLFHLGLEAWWKGTDRRLEDGIAAMGAVETVDPYELVRAECLLHGYDARWGGEAFEVIAVESEFNLPLVNPETGASSRTFRLAGKVDALARNAEGAWVVEHKTTSMDAGPGSPYITRLRLDGQVSMYLRAAAELGHEPRGVIYDVIRKVGLKPYKATAVADRKFKKDGTLYANQRETDESVEEYRARVVDEVAGNPDKYFTRATVVRLESEMLEFEHELWQFAGSIREHARLNIAPRNTDSCERYGHTCNFFSVCSGSADISDESLFRRAPIHSELSAQPPKEKV